MSTPAYIRVHSSKFGTHLVYSRSDGGPSSIMPEMWGLMQKVSPNSENWVRDFIWEADNLGYETDHGMRGANWNYSYCILEAGYGEGNVKFFVSLDPEYLGRPKQDTPGITELCYEITQGSPEVTYQRVSGRMRELEEEMECDIG